MCCFALPSLPGKLSSRFELVESAEKYKHSLFTVFWFLEAKAGFAGQVQVWSSQDFSGYRCG